MAQLVPVILFHAQAVRLIDDLREAYSSGIGSVDELTARLRETLSAFEAGVGVPFFHFEPVSEGEPPLSAKMNRLWTTLSHDVNIIQRQIDVGRAAVVFAHNLVTTEILKAQGANARAAGKLKTLQLYSDAVDSSVVTFGDQFRSLEFVDLTQVLPNERVLVRSEYHVTLAPQGIVELIGGAKPTVLSNSNGFLGNLHEVTGAKRRVTYKKTPTSIEETWDEPIFKAETNTRSNLGTIIDGEPNSWIEYEQCLVEPADRRTAGQFNFTYQRPTETGVEYVDWALGPPDGVLKLSLGFDLGAPQVVNSISYVPFSLEDNANHPVKVKEVQLSADGTNWEVLTPREVFVGTTPNLQSLRAADDVHLGSAIWVIPGSVARFVRVHIEQPRPVLREIGHVYYMDNVGNRVEGPIPPISDPTVVYKASATQTGSIIQRREVFTAKRWAIGVRDVAVSQVDYSEVSVLVTPPLRVTGLVDRVALDAEVTIPAEYDDSDTWVAFFISPDDGVNWHPIARVQDDALGIPEIIAFNDPTPVEFREPGVQHVEISTPVRALRLKVVLSRPSDLPFTTPVLHSYKIKVRRR